MRKILAVIILIFVSSPVFAFGPGFNINLSRDEMSVQGYGYMNGSNTQGYIPLPAKKIKYNKDSIEYFQIANGLYVVIIKNHNNTYKIEPYIADGVETNKSVYNDTNAILSVNAGYFDPANKKTISYITKDFEVVADPSENENLTSNINLAEHLDEIYNRSEFRILQKRNQIKYDIARHNDPVEEGWQIKHALQAGPALFPDLTAQDEYFLKVKGNKILRDSISVTKKVPRTAIGIKNNNIYLILATKNCPLTLFQLSNICRQLNLEKAMNFDGGGSTSFDSAKLHITSDKDEQARKLKSFLIVK